MSTMIDERHRARETRIQDGRVITRRAGFALSLGYKGNAEAARATCPDREALLDLCHQMEALGYKFLRLEPT